MICDNFDSFGYDITLAGKIVIRLAIGRVLKIKKKIGYSRGICAALLLGTYVPASILLHAFLPNVLRFSTSKLGCYYFTYHFLYFPNQPILVVFTIDIIALLFCLLCPIYICVCIAHFLHFLPHAAKRQMCRK